MKDIYPSYTMLFVVFNLLAWWFKGSILISWWWFALIAVLEILFSALLLAIAKKAVEMRQ
jgi:hypothetical protein